MIKKSFIIFLLCASISAHNLLFTSISREITDETQLKVTGSIPDYVEGNLYRNGFGKFEGNNFRFNHIFDSLSLILKFRIERGDVFFMAKLLKGKYYELSQKGIPTYRTMGGTTPPMNIQQRIETLGHYRHDNLNANVVRMGTHLIAVSDLMGYIILNDQNLNFTGSYNFNDHKTTMISSAHPSFLKDEPHLLYNFEVESLTMKAKFFVIDTTKPEPLKKEYFLEISLGNLPYVHSFAMTKDYIVFVAYPFYWDIEKMLLSETILPTMKWKPQDKTRIFVINHRERKLEAIFYTNPFFAFHHINAFQKKKQIVFDIITYPNASCVHEFYLETIANSSGFIGGSLRRYTLNLEDKTHFWSEYLNNMIEMPTINPLFKGQNYKFFYSLAGTEKDKKIYIAKIDARNSFTSYWAEDGHYPSEPIFVPNILGLHEDDGVILTVVLDSKKNKSYLLVLDSKSMLPLAKAYANISIPLTCHGFFENGSII